MRNERPQEDGKAKGLLARLDRAAEKMNAFLLVLAIGLAVLDFTCFWIFRIRDALPPVARISAQAAASSAPAAASTPAAPGGQAMVAAKPSRPAAAAAGF